MARKPNKKHGTVRANVSKRTKSQIVDVATKHDVTVAEMVGVCLDGLAAQAQLEAVFLGERLRRANVAATAGGLS